MNNAKKVTVGSGNVFADLGFANPEEELLKAKLIREIRSIIKTPKTHSSQSCCHTWTQAARRFCSCYRPCG
jgi:hypothetical protein